MAQGVQRLFAVTVQEEEHEEHDDELRHQADGSGQQATGLAGQTLAQGRDLVLQ